MRIAIVGASGQTGLEIVREALTRGHEVIAVARSPEKIETRDERLDIRRADVFQPDSLVPALAGAEAVITSVGKTNLREKNPDFNTRAHRHIIDAMRAHGTTRLIAISSFGAARNVRRKGLRRKLYLFLRRKFYRDMHAMEQQVLASGMDATVVRAPALHNRPPRHDWLLTTDGSLPAGLAIARADLADYLLTEVESGAHRGRVVALADPGMEAPSMRELVPPGAAGRGA